MPTTEIPRGQWMKFFDDFSRNHEGWVVTMEVNDPEIGSQQTVAHMPLMGISADTKDRERKIEITVSRQKDAYLTHLIQTPERVWLKQGEEPGTESLEIESGNGKIILLFEHVSPEVPERQIPQPVH